MLSLATLVSWCYWGRPLRLDTSSPPCHYKREDIHDGGSNCLVTTLDYQYEYVMISKGTHAKVIEQHSLDAADTLRLQSVEFDIHVKYSTQRSSSLD